MLQEFDQLVGIELAQVHPGWRFRAGRRDPVDAAVRTIPVGIGVGMSRALVVEVAEVQLTGRSEAEIRCAEPGVATVEEEFLEGRGHGGPMRLQFPARCRVAKKIASQEATAKARGEGIAPIDRAARGGAAGRLVVRDVHQVAIGKWVVQGPMLTEVLEVIRALVGVPEEAEVRGIEEIAVVVEGQAEDVAAPLAEELELPW